VSVGSSLTQSCSRDFAELRRVIRPLAGLARQRSAGFITVLWCVDIYCIYCGNRRRRWLKAMVATKLAALHWWGERTEPSARSPSVLLHYFTLTSIAFDRAIGVVGRCTFSTPSWKSAVTFVLSASSGSVKLRRKLPKDRSMRWNFLF
jgi:hypothetical protein